MRGAARAAGSALLALLSGCAGPEPFDRPNTWRATGINDSNLAAMAVRPGDLARGRGTAPTDGQAVAAAVDRLRAGRVKSFSDAGGGGVASGGAGATALTGN